MARLQREEKLVMQLSNQEQDTLEKFDSQIKMREERYAAVRKILEQNVKIRDRAEARFQQFFEKEVNQLHNDVRNEVEIREREDDEIVEALNRYTMKLQKSLYIINSTNM